MFVVFNIQMCGLRKELLLPDNKLISYHISPPARRNVKRKLALHSEISRAIKRHSVRELVTTSEVNVSADGITLDGLHN